MKGEMFTAVMQQTMIRIRLSFRVCIVAKHFYENLIPVAFVSDIKQELIKFWRVERSVVFSLH